MVTNIDSDITQTIDKNKTEKKQFCHKNEEETKKTHTHSISENFPTQETKENVINARRGRMHKI